MRGYGLQQDGSYLASNWSLPPNSTWSTCPRPATCASACSTAAADSSAAAAARATSHPRATPGHRERADPPDRTGRSDRLPADFREVAGVPESGAATRKLAPAPTQRRSERLAQFESVMAELSMNAYRSGIGTSYTRDGWVRTVISGKSTTSSGEIANLRHRPSCFTQKASTAHRGPASIPGSSVGRNVG